AGTDELGLFRQRRLVAGCAGWAARSRACCVVWSVDSARDQRSQHRARARLGWLLSRPSGLSRCWHVTWNTLVRAEPRINGGGGGGVSVQRLELCAGIRTGFRTRSRARVAHAAGARARRCLSLLSSSSTARGERVSVRRCTTPLC